MVIFKFMYYKLKINENVCIYIYIDIYEMKLYIAYEGDKNINQKGNTRIYIMGSVIERII